MEATAQLFRALASSTRLPVLRVLTVLPELNVNAIADATSRHQCRVSVDLRVLATSGLVWRRRAGRYIYYRLAERAVSPVLRVTLDTLRNTFGAIRSGSPRAIAASDQSRDPERSDAALMNWFGGFTHPRRLQILKSIATGKADTALVLSETWRMSYVACTRHLVRLCDGGILRATPQDGQTAWRIAPGGPKWRRALVNAVLRQLTATRE